MREPERWFTAAELAALRLPGLPRTKRRINARATAEGWPWRPASQRGGGRQYPLDALPLAARMALAARAAGEEPAPLRDAALVEAGPALAEGVQRAVVLDAVEERRVSAGSLTAAVAAVAAETGVSIATIYRWRQLVTGLRRADWPQALAPQWRGGGDPAAIDEEIWQAFVSDWLRPERPTFASCHARAAALAAARGVAVPGLKAFRRRLAREVPREVVVARREGREAVRRMLPPQERSVAALEALELVNVDGHRWDVFVRWPDGRVARPVMVAIQDVYSRKILALRIGETESAVLTRLAFADLFRDFGIPAGCLMDNGRAFASKWITGGAPSRFRFRVRAEEPLGILTLFGIRVHWTTPYRGQSKPIERAFRDFCDAVAKHPALAGAWTGNRPDAKPENYGSQAVPLDQFEAVVRAGIAAHNARRGRRTETAQGRSFDEVFAESYARAPVGRATAEQVRLALLAADRVRADRQSGAIRFCGNSYWSPDCTRLAGQWLTIRFDPDDLHGGIHAYDAAGRFLATVPVWEAAGFLDVEAARRRAKLEAEHRRAVARQVELQGLLEAEELARLYVPEATDSPQPLPVATVLRPVRLREAAAARAAAPALSPGADSYTDRFAAAVTRLRLVEGD
ncbi:transposase domain-containing protein [Thermaurantiacus tibetensis]|uniref:transposase domain-containing protein n=1 Tax=Thermaurantiacus tibetensis TaxID=2759035 RepID=UPI00188E86C3|nr:transposase domain-containing protein [Thermaurantiacus tibetensis]